MPKELLKAGFHSLPRRLATVLQEKLRVIATEDENSVVRKSLLPDEEHDWDASILSELPGMHVSSEDLLQGYLRHTGALEPNWAEDKEEAKENFVGFSIWDAMCRRAAEIRRTKDEAGESTNAPGDLELALMDLVMDFYRLHGTPAMATENARREAASGAAYDRGRSPAFEDTPDEELEWDTPEKARRDADNNAEILRYILNEEHGAGPGVTEAFRRTKHWLETEATGADLERIASLFATSGQDHSALISALVIRHTKLAGESKNYEIWKILGSNNSGVDTLGENPFLNNEGWRALMGDLLAEIDMWAGAARISTDGVAFGQWAGILTSLGRKGVMETVRLGTSRGWSLNEAQVERLSAAAQDAISQLDNLEHWFDTKPLAGPGSKGNKFRQSMISKWGSEQTRTVGKVVATFPETPGTADLLTLALRIQEHTLGKDRVAIEPDETVYPEILENARGETGANVMRLMIRHLARISKDESTWGYFDNFVEQWGRVIKRITPEQIEGANPETLQEIAKLAGRIKGLRKHLSHLTQIPQPARKAVGKKTAGGQRAGRAR